MLVFVVFNLPPYGFTLKHMYKFLEQKVGIVFWNNSAVYIVD